MPWCGGGQCCARLSCGHWHANHGKHCPRPLHRCAHIAELRPAETAHRLRCTRKKWTDPGPSLHQISSETSERLDCTHLDMVQLFGKMFTLSVNTQTSKPNCRSIYFQLSWQSCWPGPKSFPMACCNFRTSSTEPSGRRSLPNMLPRSETWLANAGHRAFTPTLHLRPGSWQYCHSLDSGGVCGVL